MYRILGIDGKEYGPVNEEQVRAWISDRRAHATTQVQKVGESDWRPLNSFAEFSGLFPPESTTQPPRPPQPPQLPPSPCPDPDAFAASILGRNFSIVPTDCIRRGWQLYKSNFWMVLAATFIASVVSGAAGSVPYIGAFISIAFHGVIYGGLFWYMLRLVRGEKAQPEDIFAGFKRFPAQLILAGVVTMMSILFVMGIFALPFLFSAVPIVIDFVRNPTPHPEVLLSAFTAVGITCLLGAMFAAFVLTVLWSFTLPLVIDKGLPFWNAMELSRKVVTRIFGSMVVLLILSGLIMALGLLGCIVGLIITMPIPYLSLTHAYEDIFGDSKGAVAVTS